MAEVKWIKIVTDIFDDEKILIIESMPEADAIIVIWFKLLCLAGKQNNSGVFLMNNRIPYTDEMFAAVFRRNVATVRLALTTFENLGMIEIVNNAVTIPNWGKHQNLEKIEARREYERDRKRLYRERQLALSEGKEELSGTSPGLSQGRPDDVHSLEEDIDIDIKNKSLDKEGDIERDIKSNAFCAEPPGTGHSTPEPKRVPTPSEFNLILNDGTYYNVPQENIEAFKGLYPAVDVEQELRNMIGWCMSNDTYRKTASGIKRFISNWLKKEQDRARKGGGKSEVNRPDYYGPAKRSHPDELIL